MKTEISVKANVVANSGSTLTPDHFGIIQTGFGDFGEFSEEFQYMAGGHIRWPGGTLSEVQTNVYGLEIPGLFDGTQLWKFNADRVRPDLREMMDFAVSNNVGFSIQIPTARYAGDVELGKTHLTQFLNDLSSGLYGAIPKSLKFEIGNEFYGLAEFADDPSAYGALANRFLGAIDSYVTAAGANELTQNMQVGVQMGRSEVEDQLIRSEIDPANLPVIDFLIAHHLPYRFEAVDIEVSTLKDDGGEVSETRAETIGSQVTAWNELLHKHSPKEKGLSYELTGWAVGEASLTKKVDLKYQDHGARQASAALEVFSTHISNGVAGANVWGVGVINPSYFAKFEDGFASYSFGGEVFKLMSENLVGTRLVRGFEDYGRDDPFTMYTFRDIDTLEIFVSANDIPEVGYEFDLIIEGFGNDFTVSVDRIGYAYSAGAPADPNDPNLRLYEVPELTSWIDTSSNGLITVSLTQDFEVIHMTLELTNPDVAIRNFFEFSDAAELLGDHGENTLTSFHKKNALSGLDGDDVLTGGVGSDYLSGGGGDDVLIGDVSQKYFGNDVLEAGGGDDLLSGGGGADVFVFKPNSGENVIAEVNIDPDNPNRYVISGSDFDPMLDTVSLYEFGYRDAREALSHVHEDVNGTAIFSDQGTDIVFSGLSAVELLESDFFVL